MKQVKRMLMHGYVEFVDGTYGKFDARTGKYIPVHEDEASAFEEDLYFDEGDALDEDASLEDIVDFLSDETCEACRRKAYLLIASKNRPKWWHAVISACIHSMAIFSGGCPIAYFTEGILPVTIAEKQGKKMGAKRRDFDIIYRLLVEMQWDIISGDNADIVNYLLNEWE